MNLGWSLDQLANFSWWTGVSGTWMMARLLTSNHHDPCKILAVLDSAPPEIPLAMVLKLFIIHVYSLSQNTPFITSNSLSIVTTSYDPATVTTMRLEYPSLNPCSWTESIYAIFHEHHDWWLKVWPFPTLTTLLPFETRGCRTYSLPI